MIDLVERCPQAIPLNIRIFCARYLEVLLVYFNNIEIIFQDLKACFLVCLIFDESLY